MLPHRPATASTSNPSQANVAPLRTPDASPRIRKDAATDVRFGVGRHRDKLELIRNSLRPFEQTSNNNAGGAAADGFVSGGVSSGGMAHGAQGDSNGEDEARRQIMINTLTQIGFEQEAALLALQLVRFSSVAAAAEVLLNINNVVQQEAPPRLHNGLMHQTQAAAVRPPPPPSSSQLSVYASGSVGAPGYSSTTAVLSKAPGLPLIPTVTTSALAASVSGSGVAAHSSAIAAGALPGATAVTVVGTAGPQSSSVTAAPGMAGPTGNLDDSCSSRSNSPLARIPSPSTAFNVRSPSPTRQLGGFHPQPEYHRTHAHLTLGATQGLTSGYEQHLLPSCSSQSPHPALPTYQGNVAAAPPPAGSALQYPAAPQAPQYTPQPLAAYQAAVAAACSYQPGPSQGFQVTSAQVPSQSAQVLVGPGSRGPAGLACAKKVDRPHPMQATSIMSIERGVQVTHGSRMIRPVGSSGAAAHSVLNGNALRRADAVPVIRARLDRPPRNTLLQINVDALQMASDGNRRNRYHLSAVNDETGETMSTVHGQPAGMNSVQTILVDPEMQPSSSYANYVDQLCRRTVMLPGVDGRDVFFCGSDASTSSSMTSSHRTPLSAQDVSPLGSAVNYDAYHRAPTASVASSLSATSHHSGPSTCAVDADGVTRCVSPLPEVVTKRLRTDTYEAVVRPCRPRMFCFFMEQHVERLIQQYKERQQRAHQLAKEMECANLPENLREQMMKFLTQKESRYLRLRRQKMDKNMFEVIRHIGFGAFGRVSLVKKKDTAQVYAMKTLLKKDVIMKQQAAHVKAERDILAEANSQWIVKLFFSFQDQQSLYFIMEYVPGGDMMQLLINKGIFSEKLARSYIAELTCAIEYVHRLGFIHRDIKPDNILIDQNGHLKLTDFGLCTGLRWTHDKRYYGPDNDEVESSHSRNDSFSIPPHLMGSGRNHPKVLDLRHHCKRNQSHSLVGTDNYMAPEVIRGTGHTQLCDWWSVGVILYEMVFGMPPFMSEDRYETQFKIVNWRQFLDLNNRMGAKLSNECISLIRRLCCDQEDRLGAENGAPDIKLHPWFKGIDFATLRSTPAEYLPRVDHAEDTSNFETFEVDSKDDSASLDSTVAMCANNNSTALNPAFYEFTFRHFFDFDGQGCPSLRTQRRPSLAPVFESPAVLPPPPPLLPLTRTTAPSPYAYKPVVARTDSDGFESDESLVV